MVRSDEIRRELADTAFADVRWVAETGSTNADVLELAAGGAREGIVVVADHQTAGRGRLDRRWEAPPGASLLLSILTRPVTGPTGLPASDLHLVATAAGVAAAEAARAATGADIRLKWPNDLVVDVPPAAGGDPSSATRKLSGILAESVVVGTQVDAVVVGIGINVNWPVALPEELDGIATALNHVAGHDLDRGALLVALVRRLDDWYRSLASVAGRRALLIRARELSGTIGHRVRVELPGETIVGDAIDITGDGHLLVVDDCPDRPREITVGDVVHLRRQPEAP